LVRHLASPQSFKDCCGAFNLCTLRLLPYIFWQQVVLFSRSIGLRLYRV
jgi:hypothetical protein